MASTASPNARSGATTIDSRVTASPVFRVLAVAVPLIWVAVAFLHPQDLTTANRGTWLLVHSAQLALAPLLGLLVWLLLDPLGGVAAWVGRIALFMWVAFFSAFDAIAGIATGVLQGGGFEGAATYLFDHQTVGGGFSVLGSVAHPMWVVVAIACGIALRKAGAPSLTWIAMLVSVLFAAHSGPPAAVGLVALGVALWTGLAWEGKRQAQPNAPQGTA